MPIISLRQVTKRYRGHAALTGVDLDLEAGGAYGLVGPNGAGKSVLLRIITGLTAPTSGTVWIDPAYLSSDRTFPDRFGAVIDGPTYLPHLTGRENLRELQRIGSRSHGRTAVIDEALQRVGLDPDLRQAARTYSAGMRQKLALAAALLGRPEVLVLDEPFNGLDYESVDAIRELLHVEHQAGTTLLFSSHNRADIDALADTVLRLENGAIS